jgi:hypothetical protein
MSEEQKVLTKEVAEQYLKQSWSVSLNEFTSADLEAIEVLSKKQGDLDLRGLRTLTPGMAELLASHRGMLWLDGIAEVDDTVAASLARHEGGLSLSGLPSLSGTVATSLAHSQGMLGLSGLREFSDADAKAIVGHKGLLLLDGIETVPDTLAETLSEHGGGLCLGAKTLSDRAAEFLSKTKGELQMWNLASLSDSPAQLGLLEKLTMNEENVADLSGLLSLSDAAVDLLEKFDGQIMLNSLESLDGPAGKLVEKIFRDDDGINLSGLRSLPDNAAEKLSKYEGTLDLSGLQSLSDGAAVALSSHEGDLNLSGLKNLSQTVIDAIAKHQGQVYLAQSVWNQMEASLPPLQSPVSIGIVIPSSPRWKGVARFRISWSLVEDIVEGAGFDVDWADASVVYDFSTGQAAHFDVLAALVERGLAVPYLKAEVDVWSAFPQDDTLLFGMEAEILEFDTKLLDEVIRTVHAHGLELIATAKGT